MCTAERLCLPSLVETCDSFSNTRASRANSFIQTVFQGARFEGDGGIFFEAAAQRRFQDGVTLELVPLVRLPSSRRGTNPRWYSTHVLRRGRPFREDADIGDEFRFFRTTG